MKPQRIQLKRTRGFRLQEVSRALNGLPAVNVARPTRWGNPFKVKQTNRAAVEKFRFWVSVEPLAFPSREEIRYELGHKNLACWCPPNQPCHADVLLEIANRP